MHERIISPQHWEQNATSANEYATTLDVTWCITHHDCATLICSGGLFFSTVLLYKKFFFTLHTAPG